MALQRVEFRMPGPKGGEAEGAAGQPQFDPTG